MDAQYATQQYQRNYYWSFNETHPRRNDTFRVDYNPTSKLNSWVRYINDYDLDTTGSFALKNSSGQFAPFAIDHPNPGHGYAVGITYTISPTHGQRVHLRQELQHLGLLRSRPVADRPLHHGQSAVVQ